jgi:26S proteasome regulatory subunit N2
LTLLDEPDDQLKSFALKSLLALVDSHWASVSEALSKLENLAENERFPDRETACALASRCFFHLEEYDDATRLALGAGVHFDVEGSSAYSKAIVGRCLETYVNLRGGKAESEAGEEKRDLDPRLERVVERMFSNCYATKNFKRAIGMALEAKRLDKVREAVRLSTPNERAMLTYTLNNVATQPSQFRQEVMNTLVELYSESREEDVDYLEWFLCLHALQRVDDYAALLLKLVCSPSKDRALVAFQAAFDLVEFQDQRFEKSLDEALSSSPLLPPSTSEQETKSIETLRSILFGGKKAALLLDFMYKRNGTDSLLLKKFKDASEAGRKNSVLHHAMIVAHGYAQCGTTADAFLRDNLEWLGRASNWAKFGATASLGVVHKGNVESAMQLLRPYLPAVAADANAGAPPRSSPYSEGGALYALGLIHCAEGVAPETKKKALDHLSGFLESASAQDQEVARDSLLHGSCLGIGLVSVSSSDEQLIERLRNVLYSDSAVVGEAAALGMGMVMLGGGAKHASTLEDLLGYAHDTEHEKIVRAVSLCAALAYYGQEDQSDSLIEQLCRDKDHLIRYGGVFTIGSAYVGTANNAAVRRLLHIAVSDVSNDVRRAAVTCLGLVMIRLPERLPALIALLSESYNPHVRYGAALALGIGCSTQADPKEALELLEPLLDDKTDFVRQGAMIGTAFLLAPFRPEVDVRAKRFREKIFAVVSDSKQASTMTRMGALMASGIVDSGGRNAFLSIIGRNGLPKPPSVAGLILWLQYWYWYPLMHMLSLSLSPAALIGVNADLDLPKNFQVDCVGGDVAKRFGMPDPVEEKKEETKSRVKTAVLSTTAKVSLKHKKVGTAEAPSTPQQNAPTSANEAGASTTATGGQSKKSLPDDKQLLTNPIRVTKAMADHVRFRPAERYVPACGEGHYQAVGVVVLRDTSPDVAQEVVKVAVPPAGDVDPNEPQPPQPFEWTPPSN